MRLRNVGTYTPDYSVPYPRRPHCEKLATQNVLCVSSLAPKLSHCQFCCCIQPRWVHLVCSPLCCFVYCPSEEHPVNLSVIALRADSSEMCWESLFLWWMERCSWWSKKLCCVKSDEIYTETVHETWECRWNNSHVAAMAYLPVKCLALNSATENRKWRNKDFFVRILWQWSESYRTSDTLPMKQKWRIKRRPAVVIKYPVWRSRCRWVVIDLLQLIWERWCWWGRDWLGNPCFIQNRKRYLDHRGPWETCQNQQTVPRDRFVCIWKLCIMLTEHIAKTLNHSLKWNTGRWNATSCGRPKAQSGTQTCSNEINSE
jgi:hypothetical protein